jgi:glutaminyl-peptide cyclotransferase
MLRAAPILLLLIAADQPIAPPVEVIGYTIVGRFPHDTKAFTEGLLYRDGILYESTGREGQSDIRKVRLSDGRVLKSVRLAPTLFGEGITDWKDELISVTWTTGIGFRWNLRQLRKTSQFSYPGEGWGLTQNGTHLILSDGSADLRVLNPKTFGLVRRINVSYNHRPVRKLNELEWVNGRIFANVWETPIIVRINPQTGAVDGVLDLTALVRSVPTHDRDDVLNGIAYDPATDRLLVTGKNWPTLYALKLTKADSVRATAQN